MRPQVKPDWMLPGVTKEKIEESLSPFKFSGPGFYLSDKDTLLVSVAEDVEQPWKKIQPEHRIYDVHVWNVPFNQTIFQSALIPTRVDNRE